MEPEIEVDYEDEDYVSPTKPGAVVDVGEDVYGDLFDDNGEKGNLLKVKNAALEEHNKNQEAEIQRLNAKLEACIFEKDRILEENKILVRNISCIFRTAQEEIKRKNDALKEKDAIIDQWNLYAQKHLQGATEMPPSKSPVAMATDA